MATLTAKRLWGDQFTSEDLIESKFEYSDLGKLEQCITTIELVSGVTVTHGGGASAGDNLHYKDVGVHGDSDGYIDYTTQNIQVKQTEKGDSVIRIVLSYLTVTDHNKYLADYKTWSDAYQTTEVYADGEEVTSTAEGSPAAPTWSFTSIKSGEISLKYADDPFV
jgi:hypothetical protein